MRRTIAEINVRNLIHNIKQIRNKAQRAEILGIVKANAYGHGAVEIANILRNEGVNYLGIAYPEEGVELRQNGDEGEIIVVVPDSKHEADTIAEYNMQTVVASLDILSTLSDAAIRHNKIIKTHLFIDTGMRRDGIRPKDAVGFMKRSRKLKGIEMVGILTHLGFAESEDPEYYSYQLRAFNKCLAELKSAGFEFQIIHAANSAGISNIPNAVYNMVRPGFAMYGCMPVEKLAIEMNLKPVLSLKTEVLFIKNVFEGDSVGYGHNWTAAAKTRIAILPLGYGDGYQVALSNKAQCLINGKRYNIIGSICMDQCMVEIGVGEDADNMSDNIKVGDEVVIIGSQGGHSGGDSITVYELAEKAGTIPYEITTGILKRVPRVLV